MSKDAPVDFTDEKPVPKKLLVQIQLAYQDVKDLIRIYPRQLLGSNQEPVYSLVFVFYKGTEYEVAYHWYGDEGEAERDRELGELHARLEMVGYEFI